MGMVVKSESFPETHTLIKNVYIYQQVNSVGHFNHLNNAVLNNILYGVVHQSGSLIGELDRFQILKSHPPFVMHEW